MGANSVKIPVELDLSNIRSQVDIFKSSLQGVKEGTGAFKQLNSIISSLEKQFSSLSNESKNAFSSQSEINHFTRGIDKIGTTIAYFRDVMAGINLKDLNIDTSTYDSLIQKIKQIDEEISKVNIVGDMFKGQDVDSLIKELGLKLKSDITFEGLSASFDAEAAKISNKISELQEKIRQLASKRNNQNFRDDLFDIAFRNSSKVLTKNSKDNVLDKIRKDSGVKNLSSNNKTDTVDKFLNEQSAALKKSGITQINGSSIDDYLRTVVTNLEEEEKLYIKNFERAVRNYLSNNGLDKLGTDTTVGRNEDVTDYIARIEEAIFSKIESDINSINGSITSQNDVLDRIKNARAAVSAGQAQRTESVAGKTQEREQLVGQVKEELHKQETIKTDNIDKVERSANEAREALQGMSSATQEASSSLNRMDQASHSLDQMKSRLKYWFSFHTVVRLVNTGVREMINTIKELDSVMTQIAVVTSMTQEQLWDQMDTYSAIAEEFAVSIQGVYQVSQIYYQQGLQTAEVMELTTETLKMAKIAGLDYSTAADYMTVAVRGFKMEMSEANKVTDVYSALAAGTASDTEELATAMSKTASSAESVGSSFESTSAMIATMVSVTRESATNINRDLTFLLNYSIIIIKKEESSTGVIAA